MEDKKYRYYKDKYFFALYDKEDYIVDTFSNTFEMAKKMKISERQVLYYIQHKDTMRIRYLDKSCKLYLIKNDLNESRFLLSYETLNKIVKSYYTSNKTLFEVSKETQISSDTLRIILKKEYYVVKKYLQDVSNEKIKQVIAELTNTEKIERLQQELNERS